MKILIMRHGEAETRVTTDAERQLTDRGREQAATAGKVLSATGFEPDIVWCSPYRRAQQTCSEVIAFFGGVEPMTIDLLQPDTNPNQVVNLISETKAQQLMIVSHQPLVSSLTGLLVNADHRSGPPMSPASMVLLDTEIPLAGCCQQQWLKHAPTFENSN